MCVSVQQSKGEYQCVCLSNRVSMCVSVKRQLLDRHTLPCYCNNTSGATNNFKDFVPESRDFE
jgi:hypothetical protein